ncbi:MAG: hypothetical protein PF572_04600 [Patescibacteria group bacterium]|jgi:hypothetical protein|nr:hypothetical protein [Patescibacteria group bacterium]
MKFKKIFLPLFVATFFLFAFPVKAYTIPFSQKTLFFGIQPGILNVTFDKASYFPGEIATMSISVTNPNSFSIPYDMYYNKNSTIFWLTQLLDQVFVGANATSAVIDKQFTASMTPGSKSIYFSTHTTNITFTGLIGDAPYTVTSPPNNPPTATITNPPTSSITRSISDSAINFTSSSNDSDGSVVAYEWSSGSCGGTTLGTNSTLSRDFNVGGSSNTIYFRVQDNDGAWSTCDSVTVTVNNVAPTPCNIYDCPGGYIYNDISGNCEAYSEYDADFTQCSLIMGGCDVPAGTGLLADSCTSLPANTCGMTGYTPCSIDFDSQCGVVGLLDWYSQYTDGSLWWLSEGINCFGAIAPNPIPPDTEFVYCDMGCNVTFKNTSNVCPSGGTLNTVTDKCEESDPSDFLAPTVVTGYLDTDGVTCLAFTDIINPLIHITTPNTTPFNISNNTISVTAQASDNIDVTNVVWLNDRGGGGSATELIDWTVASIPLQIGANVITLTASDAAGNTAVDVITVNYNPDSSPPTINFLTPTTGNSYTVVTNTIILTGNATDDIGLDDVDYQVDGGGWSTIPGSNNISGTTNNWSRTVSSLDYGLTTIEIRASDDAGNSHIETFSVYYLPPDGELIGYIWTSTIGWISMSSKNLTSGPIYYGVKVNENTGHLSGYGWSENVGWINFESATSTPDSNHFNSAGLCADNICTSGNNCTACYDPVGGEVPSGNIYGWAHVISLGDDGWISLSNDNLGSAQNYGVEYDIDTHELFGYAWSGANSSANAEAGLGWLSTNCIDYQVCDGGGGSSNDGTYCTVDSDCDGTCSVDACKYSPYKVMGLLNIRPSVTFDESLAVRELPCGTSDGLDGACSTDCENHPEIYWDYVDPEGYPQENYEIVFDRDNNPDNSNEYDRKTETNTTDHYIPTDEGVTIKYGTTYYVHIKVWDNFGAESDWESTSFTTRDHAHPDASFDFFIEEGSASAEEEMLFWDTSVYYFDSTNEIDNPGAPGECVIPGCAYSWTSTHITSLVDANTATSTAVFPNQADNREMHLEVTYDIGYSCSTSTTLDINKKLPSWNEVR